MSKSCCFAVVLAVICLPVILLSIEADAQSTVDETTTCSSSTPGEVVNMFEIIASSQQENAKKINDVKELLESKKDCDAAEPSKQPLVSALVCEFLVSLWSPYGIGQTIIFSCSCSSSSFFLFSSPNLSRRRLDVCHTSTHGVALVRI